MNSTLVPSFSTDAQRWEALVQRNPKADGAFLYAVQTTGVYCRVAHLSITPAKPEKRCILSMLRQC